jgi:hypothetical protein
MPRAERRTVLTYLPSRGGVAFALGVALLIACGNKDDEEDNNNFRPDVIECEDAIARLLTCCPSFDPTPVECQFHYKRHTGCGTTDVDSVKPALTSDESACIRGLSCVELVDKGVCDRAQQARTYEEHSVTDTDKTQPTSDTIQKHAAVCP